MRTQPLLWWLCGLAALLAFALPATTTAEKKPKRVVLDDFEGDVRARWQNFTAAKEQVKAGETSGKWSGGLIDAVNLKIPHDWSDYKDWTLTFWCHSEKATEGKFTVVVASDDPKDDATDLYYHLITVDWTGWKEFRIPLKSLKVWGQPVGLRQVDAVTFSFETFWVGAKRPSVPGTVLHFDELCLSEE